MDAIDLEDYIYIPEYDSIFRKITVPVSDTFIYKRKKYVVEERTIAMKLRYFLNLRTAYLRYTTKEQATIENINEPLLPEGLRIHENNARQWFLICLAREIDIWSSSNVCALEIEMHQ